jgi:hypothetical protein
LRTLAASLVAVLLASGAAADEAGQIAKAEAALTGADSNEKSVLALAGARAHREKGVLVLTLDNGKSARLGEGCKATEEEPCATYSLAAFLPSDGVFVVEKNEVESYNILLIEMATGTQHTVDGPPHYAPDGKRFVTCRVDEMNGGGTRVWRVATGRYVQEFADDRMSVCGNWKDDDTFALGVYPAEPSGKPRPMTLTHKGDAWQLHDGK